MGAQTLVLPKPRPLHRLRRGGLDRVSELSWFEPREKRLPGYRRQGWEPGKARTFLDLVRATFQALGKEEQISFVDTPADIRDKYQYFTEADMRKLQSIGYDTPFTSLEEGVKDYVGNYLEAKGYL